MAAVEPLAVDVGTLAACAALGVARATCYRHRQRAAAPEVAAAVRRRPPLKLSIEERSEVVAALHSERFADQSPREVWATLLDEEQQYLCSVRTMYRILASEGELRERRDQLRHPAYAKPELLATGPNQVWSWDVTKLRGSAKWTYYYLYVILDIFSRYVVGWMVASRESGELAKRLISASASKQKVKGKLVALHSDRGSIMTAKPVSLLLADLCVKQSLNRPYTSSDNPYSEAWFKTMKYAGQFPARFGSLEDSRSFCLGFIAWYNTEHRHEGLGLLTPEAVHYGAAEQVLQARREVLSGAYAAHPNRFKHRQPAPPVSG